MTDETKQGIAAQAVEWAKGQPFNNLLLTAILGSIMYGTYFAMTTALPKHLEQIQNGYESLTDAHREERKELRETYGQWMKKESAAAHSGRATAAVE